MAAGQRHPPICAVLATLLVTGLMTGCADDPVDSGLAREGAVTGTLAHAKTGEGVPNAVVALLRDGRVVTTTATDDDGAFAIRELPPGPYEAHLTGLELTGLSLLHTTFEPITQPVHVAAEPVTLLFAAVGLVPGRVSGVVRCGGVEEAGAAIRIVGGAVDTVVESNAIGRYGLTDLAPGHYALLPTRSVCLGALAPAVVEVKAGQFVARDFGG